MNKRIFQVMLALLLCVAAVATALPSTIAYIADRSNTVRNTFRVEYLPPQDVTLPVRIHKTVLCTGSEVISPEGFSFILEELNSGDTIPVTTLADGWAITSLTFTADDVGKTYHYRLYERNDNRMHVVYDTTVYDISVSLQLNAQHEMSTILTVNGEPVTELAVSFVNRYNVSDAPNTGDQSYPLLWLILLIFSCAGLVICRKECVLRRP